jgi:hypothetical protein
MKHLQRTVVLLSVTIVAVTGTTCVQADGVVIDKIYHPYVDALESELEYRALVQDEQHGISTQAQVHQLSLGTAIGSRMFAEVYAIGEKSRTGGFDLGAWEAELKYQLTEQGEYWADWGLLVEYENERNIDVEEFSLTLLAEKEWGNWSGAANFHLINEWGDDIDPEVEFYAGQNTRGIGPVLQGTFATGVRKAVHWETGVIFGLDNDSADQTWRFLLEYEF